MRETRGFGWRGVTFCGKVRPLVRYYDPIAWMATFSQVIQGIWDTYMTSIEADGDARLLLDFLRHLEECRR